VFLGTVIGSLAILRIAGGLLLAIAPLMAGLLLFDFARGLFAGWLRGLVLVALGSLGITLLLAVEVAVLEPWLTDAVARRSFGYVTPTTPTELLAISLAFAVAAAGLLALLAKVSFQHAWNLPRIELPVERSVWPELAVAGQRYHATSAPAAPTRALSVSESVRNLLRHEDSRRDSHRTLLLQPPQDRGTAAATAPATPVGSSWRRTSQRTTAAQTSRDSNR
jgi:type IV secretion system protein VirB6